MRKIFLLICAALLISGCGGGEVKEQEKIVVGLDDEYAPFGFRDNNNEIVGFDVDLAKETARRLGVEFEFKAIDWNSKVEELNSGNIDIIWNGLDITPERQEFFLYSNPYMDNRQIILLNQNADFKITSESDLAGKRVGTQGGSNSETYVEQNETLRNSMREFKTYSTVLNAFNALSNGEVDLLICDEHAARYELSKNAGKFKLVEVTIGPVTKIGIGFRKSDVELRDKVQIVFNDMIKDGTAAKISAQWFQADLIKTTW